MVSCTVLLDENNAVWNTKSPVARGDWTKIRDVRSGRDSWCVIGVSKHGFGPESLRVMNKVMNEGRLEGTRGQTCAWRQGERGA